MRRIAAVVGLMTLSGCYSLQGPPQVVNQGGILPGQPQSSGQQADLVVNFALAARVAYPYTRAERVAAETDRTAEPTRRDVQDKQRTFMRAGFTLVYARCNDYFWMMGRRQTTARIGRDLIAPISTLLTGIINLHDFGDDSDREQELLQILTLGTATVSSGLDVYDRHLLFGAENIDSVRELTLRALSLHRTTVLDQSVESFESAVQHLIDHQAICTPPHILALTRSVIRNGQLEPTITGGPAARAELDFRARLGSLLVGNNEVITRNQLYGLWWLYKSGAAQSAAALKDLWANYLSTLPDAANPLTRATDETVTFKGNAWSFHSRVTQDMESLPPETVREFRERLAGDGTRVLTAGTVPTVQPLETNDSSHVGIRSRGE